MTLITYKPTTPFVSNIDSWIDSFFNLNSLGENNYQLNPSINISDNKESYAVTIDLPGVNKNDIDLSVSNDIMTISGERKSSDESYNIKYGPFTKSLYVPEDANTKKIHAKMKDGVLLVTIPKSKAIVEDIQKISIK